MRDRILECYRANLSAAQLELDQHRLACGTCRLARDQRRPERHCERGWSLVQLVRGSQQTMDDYRALQAEVEAQVEALFDWPIAEPRPTSLSGN